MADKCSTCGNTKVGGACLKCDTTTESYPTEPTKKRSSIFGSIVKITEDFNREKDKDS